MGSISPPGASNRPGTQENRLLNALMENSGSIPPSSISTLSEVSRSLLSDPETSTLISSSYQYANSPSAHASLPHSITSQSMLVDATTGLVVSGSKATFGTPDARDSFPLSPPPQADSPIQNYHHQQDPTFNQHHEAMITPVGGRIIVGQPVFVPSHYQQQQVLSSHNRPLYSSSAVHASLPRQHLQEHQTHGSHYQQDTSSSMHSAASLAMNSPLNSSSPTSVTDQSRHHGQAAFITPMISQQQSQHQNYLHINADPLEARNRTPSTKSTTSKTPHPIVVPSPHQIMSNNQNQQMMHSPGGTFIQQRGISLYKTGVATPTSPSTTQFVAMPGSSHTHTIATYPPSHSVEQTHHADHGYDSDQPLLSPLESFTVNRTASSSSHQQPHQQGVNGTSSVGAVRSSSSTSVPSSGAPSRQGTTTSSVGQPNISTNPAAGRSNTVSSSISTTTPTRPTPVPTVKSSRSIEIRTTSLHNNTANTAESARRGSNNTNHSIAKRENSLQQPSSPAPHRELSVSSSSTNVPQSSLANINTNVQTTTAGSVFSAVSSTPLTASSPLSSSSNSGNTSQGNNKKSAAADIMDFEQMLQSSETKRLTSTPERMRVIEVKKTQVVKLQAKAPTVEKTESPLLSRKTKHQQGQDKDAVAKTDIKADDDDDDFDDDEAGKKPLKKQESYWDFLRDTGPEDLLLSSKRQESLPENQPQPINAISPTRSSSQAGIDASTVPPSVTKLAAVSTNMSGSAPNLSPLTSKASQRSSASRIKTRSKEPKQPSNSNSNSADSLKPGLVMGDMEDSDSEDEFLARQPSFKPKKKKDDMSLADFLKNTEPPSSPLAGSPLGAPASSPISSVSGSPSLSKKGTGFKFLSRFGKSASSLSLEASRRNTAERSSHLDHSSSPSATSPSIHSASSPLGGTLPKHATSPTNKAINDNSSLKFAMLPVPPEANLNDLQPKIGQSGLVARTLAASSINNEDMSRRSSSSSAAVVVSPGGNTYIQSRSGSLATTKWPSERDLPTLTPSTPLAAQQDQQLSQPKSPQSAPVSRRQSVLNLLTGNTSQSQQEGSTPPSPRSPSGSSRKISLTSSKTKRSRGSNGSVSTAQKSIGIQSNADTIEARVQAVPDTSSQMTQTAESRRDTATISTSPIIFHQEPGSFNSHADIRDSDSQTDLAGPEWMDSLVNQMAAQMAQSSLQIAVLERQGEVAENASNITKVDAETQYEIQGNGVLLQDSSVSGSSSSLIETEQQPLSPADQPINMLLMSENTRLQQEVTSLRLQLAQEKSKCEQMKILKDAAETRFEQLARVAHRKLSQAIEEKHAVVAAVASAVVNTGGIVATGAGTSVPAGSGILTPSIPSTPAIHSLLATAQLSSSSIPPPP